MRLRRSPLLPFVYRETIFIHIPKAGGSAIKKLLRKKIQNDRLHIIGHPTYLEYIEKLKQSGFDKKYETFAVVRNPWDWHVSWYHYLKFDKDGRDSGHRLEHELFNKIEFPDYVRWLADDTADRSPQRFLTRQQVEWLVDESDHVAVEHILKFETLAEDLSRFLNRRISLPAVNVSPRNRDYRRYYKSDTAEIVANRHCRDISEFGYAFDCEPECRA